MSFFGSLVKVVTTVVEKLGPAIPILLGIIQTKTNENDRDGLQKAFDVLKAVGAKLIRLGEIGEASIGEFSEGGTAITGNEYKAFVEEAYDTIDEIAAELKGLE